MLYLPLKNNPTENECDVSGNITSDYKKVWYQKHYASVSQKQNSSEEIKTTVCHSGNNFKM